MHELSQGLLRWLVGASSPLSRAVVATSLVVTLQRFANHALGKVIEFRSLQGCHERQSYRVLVEREQVLVKTLGTVDEIN